MTECVPEFLLLLLVAESQICILAKRWRAGCLLPNWTARLKINAKNQAEMMTAGILASALLCFQSTAAVTINSLADNFFFAQSLAPYY